MQHSAIARFYYGYQTVSIQQKPTKHSFRLVVNELTRFYLLSAEMAAFLHPHTHQKKSGLCCRE